MILHKRLIIDQLVARLQRKGDWEWAISLVGDPTKASTTKLRRIFSYVCITSLSMYWLWAGCNVFLQTVLNCAETSLEIQFSSILFRILDGNFCKCFWGITRVTRMLHNFQNWENLGSISNIELTLNKKLCVDYFIGKSFKKRASPEENCLNSSSCCPITCVSNYYAKLLQ